MKYMLLIYGDPTADAPPEKPADAFPDWPDATQTLSSDGVVKAGDGLQPADTATTVRFRGGEKLVTDGPFAETKEALAGYLLFEADDLDAALALAARIPAARLGGAVEVRPIVEW